MFWSLFFLAIPALALGAALWGVIRRKWYGFLPIAFVAPFGWVLRAEYSVVASEFLEALGNQKTANQAMTLVLASGTALMSLAALWAGWSRVHWFWRLLVLAGVPAILVPLEAGELILLCWLVMPVLAGVAWLVRRRVDRTTVAGSIPPPPVEAARPRRQFSLRELLLAFVVLGVTAMSIRSLLVGHVLLVDWSLLWLAGMIIVAALAAASPACVRGTGRKWLIGSGALLLLAIASRWWWLNVLGDPLGLDTYYRSRFPAMILSHLLEGEGVFLAAVLLVSTAFVYARHAGANRVARGFSWVAGGLLLTAMILPLAIIYPSMIPPATRMTRAPPPSAAYETLKVHAGRVWGLTKRSAPRGEILTALWELDREFPVPGYVTHDAEELARKRLFPNRAVEPLDSLSQELWMEMQRAAYERRDADLIRLARLHWRIGQTLCAGGTFEDYAVHCNFTRFGLLAVESCASKLTAPQCRELLSELRDIESGAPAFLALRDTDNFWRNAGVGWRDRLDEATAWLVGDDTPPEHQFSERLFGYHQKLWVASQRCVQYVLALELHQREHGEFPENLAEIRTEHDLPELRDLHTDFPPVYRREGNSYLLYSIGPNGKDDGGKFHSDGPHWASRGDTFDIDLKWNRAILAEGWKQYLQAIGKLPPPAATAPPSAETGGEQPKEDGQEK